MEDRAWKDLLRAVKAYAAAENSPVVVCVGDLGDRQPMQLYVEGPEHHTEERGDLLMLAARNCIRAGQADYSQAIDDATEAAQWEQMDILRPEDVPVEPDP